MGEFVGISFILISILTITILFVIAQEDSDIPEHTLADEETDSIVLSESKTNVSEKQISGLNTIQPVTVPETQIELATEVNGQSTNDPYIQSYLDLFNRFEDIALETVPEEGLDAVIIKAGNNDIDLKGISINNKAYVIHVIACNDFQQICTLRINGVPKYGMSAEDNNEFPLDDNFVLKIKEINFNYCDGKRIRDLYFDAYDKAEIEIINEES